MACGVPSIATRLTSIPDIIEDGQSELLVQPNDSAELAAAIGRIMNDSRLAARLSEGGRKIIECDFRLPDCLELWE